MPKKKNPKVSRFESRFNIPVNLELEKNKFVNRIKNIIWDDYSFEEEGIDKREAVLWNIANAFGEDYSSFFDYENSIGDSLLRNLQALEIMYSFFTNLDKRLELQQRIEYCLQQNACDIGIRWKDGIFIKTGAKELDDELVNKVLEWIEEEKYITVKTPYLRGIISLLEAVNDEEKRRNVIRDMYEALEALSMIITGRTKKELSSNMEKYLSIVGVSKEYHRILKEYILFANRIRHAIGKNDDVMNISYKEVESFVYLTGVFIRIAM